MQGISGLAEDHWLLKEDFSPWSLLGSLCLNNYILDDLCLYFYVKSPQRPSNCVLCQVSVLSWICVTYCASVWFKCVGLFGCSCYHCHIPL